MLDYPGCGLGSLGAVGISSVYPWFSDRQPIAISLVTIGIPLGAFAWPPIMTWLINKYAWKGAFIVVAGIHLQSAVLFALLRKPPLVNDGSDVTSVNHSDEGKLLLEDFHSEHTGRGNAILQIGRRHQYVKGFCGWCEVLNNKSFPIFFLGLFVINFGHIVPLAYSTTRGILLGFSQSKSALLASSVGAGNGLGRVIAGACGRGLGIAGRMHALVAFIALAGLVSMLSLAAKEYAHLMVYSVTWGILSGEYLYL